jgi:hypothetical protein
VFGFGEAETEHAPTQTFQLLNSYKITVDSFLYLWYI